VEIHQNEALAAQRDMETWKPAVTNGVTQADRELAMQLYRDG
jgi:hypothetical protein